MHTRTARAPNSLRSACRWGAVAFIVGAMLGAVTLVTCRNHHCFAFGGVSLSYLLYAYAALSLPGLLLHKALLSLTGGGHETMLGFQIFSSIGCGMSAGFLTLALRFSYLRVQAFLHAPLPPVETDPTGSGKVLAPSSATAVFLSFSFALLLLSAVVVFKNGFNASTLSSLGFVALLSIIPLYFESRRARRVTKTEIVFAFAWLAIRRILGSVVALLLVSFGVFMIATGQLAAGLFSFVLGCVLGWWAWFGSGYLDSFRDDKPTHDVRRRRYGWTR